MLKNYTELFGVSGCENAVRNKILADIKSYITSYEIDSMGNLVAYKNVGEDKKTIILSAHMDEVGLIVTGITKDGMLKFDTVGGIDESVLVSKKVYSGDIYGVIGIKPFHHCSKAEKDEVPSLEDLFIDIGAKNEEEAMKVVTPGDYFGFVSDYTEFGDGFIKAKALDDRVGCCAIVEALKEDYDVNLICLFNVQEETGLRGAKGSVYGKSADYAIVVECTTANDLTGVKPNMTVTTLGGGAAISVMDSASIADRELFRMLVETAEKNKIMYQKKRAATGGNDAGAIHIGMGGIKTCSVSVPSRYIHSPSSVIKKSDYDSVKNLVIAFLKSIS